LATRAARRLSQSGDASVGALRPRRAQSATDTPCCPDAAGLARVSREQLGTAAGVARRGGMEDQITVPPAEMEGGRGVSGGGVCSRCGDARFGLSSFLFFF